MKINVEQERHMSEESFEACMKASQIDSIYEHLTYMYNEEHVKINVEPERHKSHSRRSMLSLSSARAT